MSIDVKTLEMLTNAVEKRALENVDDDDEIKGEKDGGTANYDYKDRR